MPVLLAHAIEDFTDIFGISGGGLNTPNHPPRYATVFAHILSLSLCVLPTLQGQFQQQAVQHAHIHPLLIKMENDTLKTSFLCSYSHDMHAIMHFKAILK